MTVRKTQAEWDEITKLDVVNSRLGLFDEPFAGKKKGELIDID